MRMFAVKDAVPKPFKYTPKFTIKCHKTTLNTEVPNTVCKLSLCKYLLKRPIKSIVPYTKSIVVPYKPRKISVAK